MDSSECDLLTFKLLCLDFNVVKCQACSAIEIELELLCEIVNESRVVNNIRPFA